MNLNASAALVREIHASFRSKELDGPWSEYVEWFCAWNVPRSIKMRMNLEERYAEDTSRLVDEDAESVRNLY